MTLVDTNVIIDILSDDPVWYDWSAHQLDERSAGVLRVNDIVYFELASRIDREATLVGALNTLGLQIERIPMDALYLAGRTFRRYRAAGGPRESLLSDFFIGAHAQVAGHPILTRDARRYRAWFPSVALITPDR